MPLRMRPRRRLISLSPCYLLTWQCRRLSTVSTPHLWTLPFRRSHTVLFLRTFLRRWVLAQLPRFSVGVFVQTPIRSTVLHDVSTQLPLTEFFIGCIFSNDPLDRQKPRSSAPRHQYKVHVPCCSRRQDSNSSPRSLILLLVLICTLRMAHLLSAISVMLTQPPVCTTQVGTHPVRSSTTAKRSAGTALAGTHNPVGADLSYRNRSFS